MYISNSDIIAVHLEVEISRKENDNLKTIFEHQKNEFQRTTEINTIGLSQNHVLLSFFDIYLVQAGNPYFQKL